MQLRALLTLTLLLLLCSPGRAYAWGERGHDLVARAAARLIIERSPRNDDYAALFEQKEHMLGHLANVPDIIWRAAAPDVVAANAPTHYVDLDFLEASPSYKTAPRTIAALEAQLKASCAAKAKGYVCPSESGTPPTAAMIGTAAFRIEQLSRMMVAALARAKAAGNPDDMIKGADDALLAAGIMAHFVGDLGNPWHTTRDYDGWETGQGGIHKFFEEQVVNALPLSLDEDVIAEALRTKPFQRVLSQAPEAGRAAAAKDALSIAWALAFDSRQRLDEVRALDKKTAILKPGSNDKGMHLKAERRDARDVRGEFRAVVTERLATAADTLAALWLAAYDEAGKPSLKGYQSYAYPVSPEFIKAP